MREPRPTARTAHGHTVIRNAFEAKRSGVVVETTGNVVATLPDDTVGSRHQRFIVKLQNAHTILVSHNIDLAPRIDALRKGDRVDLRGQYEWNERGGVVHWTHHDPRGRRKGGWIIHEGKTYK